MVKIESKEKLAKLLAMEDIDVMHKQVKTAMFDVKNRCLILPTWKNMPNHLYDLLVGHEVGHALYTPSDENTLKGLIEKTSKHCVNVVEDARIESLMKRRYPGLVKQFFKGYNHLIEEDFFGLKNLDLDNINLLDKLNLHFKVPSAVAGFIDFDEDEQNFVDRIEKIKEFSELEDICVDICEYIKANQSEKDYDSLDNSSEDFDNLEDFEDGDFESGSERSEEMDTDDTDDVDSGAGSNEDENSSDSEMDENSSDSETDENMDGSSYSENGIDDLPDEDNALNSKTYENFENRVNELADINVENYYMSIPENPHFENVIDYKEINKSIKDYYNVDAYKIAVEEKNTYVYDGCYNSPEQFVQMTKEIFSNAKILFEKIKKDSVKNVNHMAMDFERKKCADIYKRTSFSKTGVLDTNKMFSAKYNEDIFKKNMKTPEGKNHGLVIICDWSGSMAPHMKGCIKQLIEMVLFCKKVNIPFEVYSFTDVHTSSSGHLGKKVNFDYRYGDLVLDERVSMRNYLSSRMSAKDLNDAMINLCIFSNSWRGGFQHYPIPEEDRLGYTPLGGAILMSEYIIKDFQKKNNLQEVHSVWITDGEGNNGCKRYELKNGMKVQEPESDYNYTKKRKTILQDKRMKKNYPVIDRDLSNVLFPILKDRTGCNIVGFFLDATFGSKHSMLRHHQPKRNEKGSIIEYNPHEFVKQAKKDGYIIKEKCGYDEYYVISSVDKPVKNTEMTEKMTNRKLASVFSAKNKEFKNSRVILSRFIDLITSKLL
jgi:hypothetical protein